MNFQGQQVFLRIIGEKELQYEVFQYPQDALYCHYFVGQGSRNKLAKQLEEGNKVESECGFCKIFPTFVN